MTSLRQTQLEAIAKARAGVVPRRDAPFGRHMLRIPEKDYQALCMLYPDLRSKDPLENSHAWAKFERSPFAVPYRTSRLVKGVFKK